MTKRVDGRTARGLLIRQRLHERILSGYIDLIREGVPIPTAREVAKRAGVSLRVIFKHFSDLRALRLASFNRMQEESSEFFSGLIPECGTAAERLELFLQRHLRRLEYVTPLQRTAAMVESIDPDVAQALKVARTAAMRDLEKTLGPALKSFSRSERRELLTTFHMVCAWPSWQTLRAHHRLSPARARSVISSVALTVLAEAERRVRAARAAAARRDHQPSRPSRKTVVH